LDEEYRRANVGVSTMPDDDDYFDGDVRNRSRTEMNDDVGCMGSARAASSEGHGLLQDSDAGLREDCKRGSRSVTYTIRNGSKCTLNLHSSFTDEVWVKEPTSVKAGEEITFAARSNGMMNGVEGKVVFEVVVPDDGPVCSALHLTFEVPFMGYSKFTKRAPPYLGLRMQNDRGNHPRVSLLVIDAEDEVAGDMARGEEVQRYVMQQEAGFERIRRSQRQQTGPSMRGRLVTVKGTPVTQVAPGTILVDATLPGASLPHSQPAGQQDFAREFAAAQQQSQQQTLGAAEHTTQMMENTKLLSEMVANDTVSAEADFMQELLVDCRRQMRMVAGILESETDEEAIGALLTANDALAQVVEECTQKLNAQQDSGEDLLSA